MHIRQALLAIGASVCAVPAFGQTTWFVDDDAPPAGDGLSWASAFEFLQDALAVAGPGDEIRVAQGHYRPDQSFAQPGGSGLRTDAFVFADDVTLRGGYQGLDGQGDPNDHDPDTFESVLSGDLNQDDRSDFTHTDDNSVHVVETTGSGAATLIDGFTIRDGSATVGSNAQRRGAGVYHFGGGHTFSRCRVVDNRANEFGGGIFALGPIQLVDCVVSSNLCQGKGGGLYMQKSGLSPAAITSTTIEGNDAPQGGGIWVQSGSPAVEACVIAANGHTGIHVSSEGIEAIDCQFLGNVTSGSLSSAGLYVEQGPATLVGCSFEGNQTQGSGRGAAWLRDAPNLVSGCQFIGNHADSGAAGVECAADTVVEDCHFESNSTTSSGGALTFWAFEEQQKGIVSLVEACTFVGNSTSSRGSAVTFDDNSQAAISLEMRDCIVVNGTGDSSNSAAVHIEGGAFHVSDCHFEGNSSNSGGIVASSNGSIVNCDFINNFAFQRGGALMLFSSTAGLLVEQCRFIGNSSNSQGGAVYSDDKFVRFSNCLFTGNGGPASDDGGAIAFLIAGLQTSITSCTITQNECGTTDAAGLYVEEGVFGDLSNTILWANKNKNGMLLEAQHNLDMSFGFVRNCCIDGYGDADAFGNFDIDPTFIGASGPDGIPGTTDDDLRLGTGSSCIERGDDNAVPADEFDLDADGDMAEPLPVDLNGGQRFVDDPATPSVKEPSTVDVGCFEYQVPTLVTFGFPMGVPNVVTPDAQAAFEVTIMPGDDVPDVASIAYRINGGSYSIEPLTPIGRGSYEALLPGAPCGSLIEYYFIVDTVGGMTPTFPVYGALSPLSTVSANDLGVALQTDLEDDAGWIVGADDDDATEGVWVHDDPNGTSSQSEDDHTPGGVQCFFTGQGKVGGSQSASDVDGGKTTLMTPPIDLAGAASAQLTAWYWYTNLSGAGDQEDVFLIEASSDGGATWTLVQQVGPAGTVKAWKRAVIDLTDAIDLTGDVRVRFVASDLGEDTVIEAAVDDVRIDAVFCSPACAADLNSDGVLNILDFIAFQNAFSAMDGSADCNGDGGLNVLDFVCFQNLFTAGCP